MKLTVGHPTLGDLVLLCGCLPAEEREQSEALTGGEYDAEQWAVQIWMSQGPKVCLFNDEGMPVAAMGLRRLRRGVFDTWYIAPDCTWLHHGRELTKRTAQLLNDTVESGAAHRVECYVLDSRERAKRWYGTIGLTFESTMQRMGVNGENFSVFVKTRQPIEV